MVAGMWSYMMANVRTFYCADGCNVLFTAPIAGTDYPTKEELKTIVCKKCGKAGFNEQNSHGKKRQANDG